MSVKDLSLTASLEDYLEAIAFLAEGKGHAHSNEIAERLGVKMPSVTVALRQLSERGLVCYERYMPITLTEAGEKAAATILRRHEALRKFFTGVLAIDEEEADRAACRVEHAVGEIITSRLIEFTDFIETCPRAGVEWIRGFGDRCTDSRNEEKCHECLAKCVREHEEAHTAETKASGAQTTTLDVLLPGERGEVVRVGTGIDRLRLASMGVLSGASVHVLKVAPLGDPISIRVKGYELSMRKEEAREIVVVREILDGR